MREFSREFQQKICAVIVTYFPEAVLAENVRKLLDQVKEVVIVDNGSAGESKERVNNLEGVKGVFIIRNESNLGIAAALNSGIRYAIEKKYPWVATFDQDSRITEGFFSAMMQALEKHPSQDEIALLAPVQIEEKTDSQVDEQKIVSSGDYSFVQTAITSGSLIRASVFGEVGFYDESLFIDYVDFDYCFRISMHGYKMVQINKARLMHRLGNEEGISLLGIKKTVKAHSATRYYYIMRNRLLMYRRYSWVFPAWVMHDMGWLTIDLTKIVLFETNKTKKFKLAMKGFVHGLGGRVGPLVD
jgi:rhamnosyltransferase